MKAIKFNFQSKISHCKRQIYPGSTKRFKSWIIYSGETNIFKNDLVKQYFSEKKKKDIYQEYNVSKSTLWWWICKYGNLVQNDRKITEDILQEGEFKSHMDKLFEILNKANPQSKSRLEEAIKYITTRKDIF